MDGQHRPDFGDLRVDRRRPSGHLSGVRERRQRDSPERVDRRTDIAAVRQPGAAGPAGRGSLLPAPGLESEHLGLARLALGLAAQDTLSNIFGELSIIADAPYKVGDWVNLDGGERGRVTKIGLRSTRMMTRDDVEITVPNAAIASGKIINESGGPSKKSRVSVQVRVAYGSDVDQVREVLLRAAHGVEFVVDDPEPRIRFTEMADSAIVFSVLCWIELLELRGQCVDGLNTAIYKALNAEGITIPFPQRDVHLYPDTAATPTRS